MQFYTYPQVIQNNSLLPLERTHCILGVTFDVHFKSNAYVKSIVTQALPRINIFKSLAGTNWGQPKETILIITYVSRIRSLFFYTAPIRFPNTSPSHIQKHQNIQNSALRIATGCAKMTSIDHFHEETKILSVQDHLSLTRSNQLSNLTTFPTVYLSPPLLLSHLLLEVA